MIGDTPGPRKTDRIYDGEAYILMKMKHLIDLDEAALERARRRLGLPTIKATVNAALRLAAGPPQADDDVEAALAALAAIDFDDRSAAWR